MPIKPSGDLNGITVRVYQENLVDLSLKDCGLYPHNTPMDRFKPPRGSVNYVVPGDCPMTRADIATQKYMTAHHAGVFFHRKLKPNI